MTQVNQLRAIAGDSPAVATVKVLTRLDSGKTLIWEHMRRQLRLREYFPAAGRVDDLAATDAVELLSKASDLPAAGLTMARSSRALPAGSPDAVAYAGNRARRSRVVRSMYRRAPATAGKKSSPLLALAERCRAMG